MVKVVVVVDNCERHQNLSALWFSWSKVEVVPSWHHGDIHHSTHAFRICAVFILVLFADLKILLHYNRTVFRLNNGSSKVVWLTIKKAIIVVVHIKDEWWERLKIFWIIDLILQFESIIEEGIAIILNYLGFLDLRDGIPSNDIWIRCSLSIGSWQIVTLVDVSSDLYWVRPLSYLLVPCWLLFELDWTIL